jgi:hypothetical protein
MKKIICRCNCSEKPWRVTDAQLAAIDMPGRKPKVWGGQVLAKIKAVKARKAAEQLVNV